MAMNGTYHPRLTGTSYALIEKTSPCKRSDELVACLGHEPPRLCLR